VRPVRSGPPVTGALPPQSAEAPAASEAAVRVPVVKVETDTPMEVLRDL
jgi:hypothetical protein